MTTTPPAGPPDAPQEALPPRSISPWRLVLALATAFFLVLFLRSWADSSDQSVPTSPPLGNGEPVFFEQQRPEEEPIRLELAHFPGMTVHTATLQAGSEQPEWASSWRGEGEMALLESLGSLPNQGAEGLNWQFEVNGTYADRGAGAYELSPGDRVLWKLAPYE